MPREENVAAYKRQRAHARRERQRERRPPGLKGPRVPKGFQHFEPEPPKPKVVAKPKPTRGRGFQHGGGEARATAAPPEVKKPSFETAVAARKGDRAAQRKVALWIKSQRAKKAAEARVQALEDRALFGAAEATIKGARKTADPRAMAVVEALSPSTAIEEAYRYGRKGEIGPAALSALSVIPGPVKAARAARVAKAAARAEKADIAAAAKIGKGGFQHKTRTIKVGQKEQQLQGARSRITRYGIEKPTDIVSEAMMGKGKVAAAARRVLPTASAEARVTRHAGRATKHAAQRATARQAQHIKHLPREGSDKDIAHFWWAQLPASERNVAGLGRVRVLQAQELARVTSPEYLASLVRRRKALKAEIKATEEAAEKMRLLKLDAALKIQISDIPKLKDHIALSIARLDEVIAKPPELNAKIIAAVHSLSGERRALLEGAGLLEPEQALTREGLISRTLGLEPTGEEAFVGHRLGEVRGARESLAPGSPGVGKVRIPQGLSQANKAILIRQGRLRQSTHVAAKDWQASQVYRSATRARNDLGKIGESFDIEQGLPRGYMLVNPRGRAVPPQWKTDALAKLADEGANEEEIRKAAEQITSGFLADQTSWQRMVDEALEQGVHWDELRIVPEKAVKRYYDQFTSTSTGGIGRVYDTAVDVMAANIVFLRLGYIPKNVVQNLIMVLPHQGVLAPFNVSRAVKISTFDPELRTLIAAEVGMGPSGAIAQEATTKILSGGAHAVTSVADMPLRVSAWLHEAAAEGIIPRFALTVSPEDRAAMMAFLRSDSPKLNDVGSRATEAMADFSRLTPKQRKAARRILIIPGWLAAGSRYPFHFAATHPIRSAAMGYVAAGEPGAPEEYQFNRPINEYFMENMPSWMPGVSGEVVPGFLGGGEGKIMRTGSISPVSTPWDIGHALAGRDVGTAADYFNPVPEAIINIAARRVETPGGGMRRAGYLESIQRNVLERIFPNVKFAQDLINPPTGEGIYPGTSRWARIKREAGIFPISVNKDAALRSKLYESGTPAEKARYNLASEYRAKLKDHAAGGIVLSEAGKENYARAFALSSDLAAATAGKETAADRVRAAVRLDNRKHKIFTASYKNRVLREIRTNTEAKNEDILRYIQGVYGGSVRDTFSTYLGQVLDSKNIEPTEAKTVR